MSNVIVTALERIGTPVTRENYIRFNWAEDIPEVWTAEEEDQLPPELQNWELFTYARGRLTYIGPPLGGGGGEDEEEDEEEDETLGDYNPDQPRAPKGSEEGGQWVKGGGGGSTRASASARIPGESVPRSGGARAHDFQKVRVEAFKKEHGRDPNDDEGWSILQEAMDDYRHEKDEAEKVELDKKVAEIGETVAFVAKQQGYDPKDVEISVGSHKFVVNGVEKSAAGVYNTQTGKITLYADRLNEDNVKGVLAHEIMHHRYQVVHDEYERQSAAAQNEAARLSAIRPNPIMKPDGTLTPEGAAKYPIYAQFSEQFSGPNVQALRESDGVSDYSEQYWKAEENSKYGYETELAVNETLAEMAKLDLETNGEMLKRIIRLRPDQPWGKLYTSIRQAYRKLRRTTQALGDYDPDQPRAPKGSEIGGRWVEGGGGGGLARAPADADRSSILRAALMTPEQKQAKVQATIAKVSADLGFDPKDVHLPDEDYEFELEGEKCNAAGSYDSATGKVAIYPKGLTDLRSLPGLLAHEIEHHKYSTVKHRYDRQRNVAVSKDLNVLMKVSDGSATSDERAAFAGKYPVLMALHDQFQGDNVAKLREQDGVSDYSEQYWREEEAKARPAWTYGGFTASKVLKHELAINETLAEIAKLDYEDGRTELLKRTEMQPDQPWGRLYATINELYAQLSGRMGKEAQQALRGMT